MTFFNDKILTIRHKINHLLPLVGTNTLSRIEILETAENLTNYLDSFSLITLDQLTKIISSSKHTTYILDPIPTKLLKEILPLIDSTLLNTIHLSLSSEYVPQSFKLAVIKPLLRYPTSLSCLKSLKRLEPISCVSFSRKITYMKTFSRGLELITARRQPWQKSLMTF